MKKISRRDKLKIYGDLLSILYNEPDTEQIKLTKVQVKINVPFDRLKNYLSDLKELDLIKDEYSPIVTKKGKEFIKEYENILKFMKRMGIAYR